MIWEWCCWKLLGCDKHHLTRVQFYVRVRVSGKATGYYSMYKSTSDGPGFMGFTSSGVCTGMCFFDFLSYKREKWQ